MDPDDSIDLKAADAVSFVIPRAETRQQEIITRGEPEGTDKVSNSKVDLAFTSHLVKCGTKDHLCFPLQTEYSQRFPAPTTGDAPSSPFCPKPKPDHAGNTPLT